MVAEEQTQCPSAQQAEESLGSSDTFGLLNSQQSSSLQQHEHEDAIMVVPPSPVRKTLPPRHVHHTYRDFSNVPLEELPTRKKAPTNFPSKLHQILSNPEYAHIISWMPHGRAWKIHNKELLIRDIVPMYFVQSKFESFARQLNGWGFKRLHQSGNDFNAFYHECFLRGMPHLTLLMKRVPPNQGKLLPYVEGEPNFYEIEQQFPLPPRSIPRNNSNCSKTNECMTSTQVSPPTFEEASAKTYVSAAAGYGHDCGASSGFPPHLLHTNHFRNPANLISSFYPGINICYPPSLGGYHQGRITGIAEPPFYTSPVTTGEQMLGGLLRPQQYFPNFFDNPTLCHGMTSTPTAAVALSPRTTALSLVQGGFR